MPFSYPFTTTEFEVRVRTSAPAPFFSPPAYVSIPFQEVEGLGSDVQIDTYFEGNNRAFPLHIPTSRETGQLTLKRGEDSSGFLLTWHQQVISALAGNLQRSLLVTTVVIRRPFKDIIDGKIKAFDIVLDRAWPKEVSWSGMNALASEVWLRKVVLVYRSLGTIIRPIGG